MKDIVYKYCSVGICLAILYFIMPGCANRGIGPQGGPIDSIPPVVVSEYPQNGTLLFNQNNIEIAFNEYIKLNNVQRNIFFSPPLSKQPEVQAIGKKIKIHIEDSLKANTTYFINFGDAIADNNENNILKDYSLCFSTGNSIDSLAMFGQVVNAIDLNPVSDIIVGIHDDLSDTALFTKPFVRIGKTDEYGMFAIKNIASGQYKIYALNDLNNDFMFQPGEHVAFIDSVFIPQIEHNKKTTTEHKDSLLHKKDTLNVQYEQHDEQNDIVLFLFIDDFRPSYFRRANRPTKNTFDLYFSAPQDSLPQIRALRPEEADTNQQKQSSWIDWTHYLITKPSINKDTIHYWITDSIAMQDSLYAEITFFATDSNQQLVQQKDTLTLLHHTRKLNNRTLTKLKKKEEERKIRIKSNGKNNFEVYDTLSLFFDVPLKYLYEDSVHFFTKKDTLKRDVPFSFFPTDSSHTEYKVIATLIPEESYYLVIDSGGAVDIYDHVNNVYKTDLRVRALSQYSTLNIILKHHLPNMRLQLLDVKENIVRDVPCTLPNVKFINLNPKDYYLRLYYDLDQNGKYTTGDIKSKRQPEPVFYFPSKLTLRANWDFEENFDHLALPQLQAKPIGITKDVKDLLNKTSK